MKWSGRLLLLACALPSAPAAAQQLVSQRVIGANRVCNYANPNPMMRRRTPTLERVVGRGEPCPRRYIRPERSPDAPAPAATIPALATLIGEERENGQLICTYEYRGQRFFRRVAITQTCPYTPHFPR